MNAVKFIRSKVLLLSSLLVVVIISISGLMVIASSLALPKQLFHHTPTYIEYLTEDMDIAGWTNFDKPSYQIGEVIEQQVRVIYRQANVTPDLESLRRRMSFFPLEQRDLNETTIIHANGITEFILDYKLQGVRVEPQNAYLIDPYILYYSNNADNDDNVYSVVIQPPVIHIAAYYPRDMKDVFTQSLKGKLDTANTFRQTLISVNGLMILVIAAIVLWHFGRRRLVTELSEDEVLWRVFNSMKDTELDNRTSLLNYEQIFTHLLHYQSGIQPDDFWSGEDPEDEPWHSTSIKARELLLENYHSVEPGDTVVEEMKKILDEKLSSIVTASRMKIESGPTFSQRISQQPVVITHAAVLVIVSLVLLTLAAIPNIWLSKELQQYNNIVASLSDTDAASEENYLALSALGDSAINISVKSAALYNAGTLRASNSFSMGDPEREELILNAVIESRSVEALFHALLEGPFTEESQIVTILLDGVEQLRRAQLDLQGAVRVSAYEEDIQRNLEIILKRRSMVIGMLGEIRRFYRSQKEGEEEALSEDGILNLLEAELPEDEEEESAGKDDRGYMILERF